MKFVKSLGLLAIAAAAMMAFAASASATTVTGEASEGTPADTPKIHAVNEPNKHIVLDNPIAKIECESTFEVKVEQHGAGVTAKGNISSLSFSNCTNNWHMTVVSAGSLEIHYTSGVNGTVTASGWTIENTRFGVNCRYATNNTHIGTVTGGNPATLHIEAKIPFHGGSFLCGSGATTWTGAYVTTGTVDIDA